MHLSGFRGRCQASAEAGGFGYVCREGEWPEPTPDLQREHAAGDSRTPDDGTCAAPCAVEWRADDAVPAADLADDGRGDGDGGAVALDASKAGMYLPGAVDCAGRRDGVDCADRGVGVHDGVLRSQGAAG